MKEIWKFPLDLRFGVGQFHMAPGDARPLHAGLDGEGTLCVWMMVNVLCRKRNMEFAIFGTGHSIPPEWLDDQYVGQHVDPYGIVFHVFARQTINLDRQF